MTDWISRPRALSTFFTPIPVSAKDVLAKEGFDPVYGARPLRRAIQAVCEKRDAGDLTTIEDPTALQQIKDLIG